MKTQQNKHESLKKKTEKKWKEYNQEEDLSSGSLFSLSLNASS